MTVFRTTALALVSALIGFTGCAASKRVSEPLPPTFLEGRDLSTKKDRLPFDHAWSDPSAHWETYSAIYLKPVRTDLLPKDAWIMSQGVAISSKDEYLAEVNKLALYFQEQLVAEIRKREGQHLAKLADRPGPGVVVMEIALTEVEFSHPIAKAGAFAVPLPGTSVVGSAVADPYATFALKVTDGVTGRVIATAADRKFAPFRVLDLNKFTATSANREICSLWAEEIAQTMGSDSLAKIEETSWKTLPW